MRKHSVIFYKRCDKLTFWLGHCQHSKVKGLSTLSVKAKPHAEPHTPAMRSTKETTPKYIVPTKRVKVSKAAPKVPKILEVSPETFLLPVPPSTKRARTPKAILKAIPKKSPLLAPSLKAEKLVKPLELAMVGAAPF